MYYRVKITNWEKYNDTKSTSARSRKSAHWWFKLNNNFIEDQNNKMLSDTELIFWISCLCLASKNQSETIILDLDYTRYYRGMCSEKSRCALKKLSSHGYLTYKKAPRIEEIRREEKPPIVPQGGQTHWLAEIWNQHRGTLPEVRSMSSHRMRKVLARVGEESSREVWATVVQRIAASPFHTGKNDRGWIANFDWLLKPDTREKVLEWRPSEPQPRFTGGDKWDPEA